MHLNSIILGMLVPFLGRRWSIKQLPEQLTNLKQLLSFASINLSNPSSQFCKELQYETASSFQHFPLSS